MPSKCGGNTGMAERLVGTHTHRQRPVHLKSCRLYIDMEWPRFFCCVSLPQYDKSFLSGLLFI